MSRFMTGFVRGVDRMNYRVGRLVMYGIFIIIGVLMWSTFTKVAPNMRPSLWTLEMAQFLMVGYFVLGGPYSIQLDSNVRMDLLYGSWTPRRKAAFDVVTVLFLLTFLVFLLIGGVGSTIYSFQYGERSYSPWRPYMWPIKVVMVTGIGLMILQALAELCRDILRIRGIEVKPEAAAERNTSTLDGPAGGATGRDGGAA